jgi:LacI family transcriptional regulator
LHFVASLRDIAKATKLSVATVSRALRNHPSVKQETIQRIQREAKRLGYQFNPYVGQMMSALRHQQGEKFLGSLAWVRFERSEFKDNLKIEAARRASELGYSLSEFDYFDYRPERLAQIMKARGIQGVLFSPPPEARGKTHFRFPVEAFSCVSIGWGIVDPLLHNVRSDHFESMQIALHHARHRFGNGIAAINDFNVNRRTNYHARAAYLAFHPAGPAVAETLFLEKRNIDREKVLALFRKYRVKCLISYSPEDAPPWMDAVIPHENRIYLAPVRPGVLCMGWISRRWHLLSRWAVEMLTGLVQRGERGVSEIPYTMFVGSEWRQMM